MHGGKGFYRGPCIFFNAVRTWKLWNAWDFFHMRLSRLAGKSAGWDSKGPGSIRELEVQVPADKSSACCIPPVISAACPLQLPASPGSAQITFGSTSAPARLSIEWGERVPGGSQARVSVCLIYGPSLAWYNGSPAVRAFTSFYRMSFWDVKGGLKNTLQWWCWPTAFLVTINSTFSPTLSDSACSQARGQPEYLSFVPHSFITMATNGKIL